MAVTFIRDACHGTIAQQEVTMLTFNPSSEFGN